MMSRSSRSGTPTLGAEVASAAGVGASEWLDRSGHDG
ncbi:hypothetical protein Ae263Ps1_6168 [Pseudonocardia sp. Ae263_Ps1]|nr:hypothetical protein Ae263Ps1_6168 [Pseudonocardia sp. Ae263_Ps1]